jgi:hemolysin III
MEETGQMDQAARPGTPVRGDTGPADRGDPGLPDPARARPDGPGGAAGKSSDPPDPEHHGFLESRLEHARAAFKPKLRGWLHFSAAPLALILGLGLMVPTPTAGLRAAVAVYVLTTVLLFGVSAAYHLGAGRPQVNAFLRKLDHANIYVFIAGSYTPFAAALDDPGLTRLMLGLVWGIALVGLVVRVLWAHAPRWLVTASYIGLGWVALFFLPALYSAYGPLTVTLLAIGGLLYTIGGVIYARKRPNPHPEWFGFHELFHSFTIGAYLVQYLAVALAVLG